jgi:hypothetical protein
MSAELEPRPGHVVAVSELPDCDFCGAPAAWDCPTRFGPWANLCDSCNQAAAVQPGVTGVGIGQRLVVREGA